MTTETDERTPLDDPLLRQVRATLDSVDAAVAARPDAAPDWARVQGLMKATGRRRRRVRAGRLGAGVVALGAGVAVVLSGAVPYPSFAPVVAVPGTAGRSALDDGRTRGSLGSDEVWLAGLRQRVAGLGDWDESGGEVWAPPAADDVSVIFAGDVGAYRLALVEGKWHWGPIGARQQVWFSGPAGSAPEAMQRGANGEPADVNQNVMSPGSDPDVRDGAAVVVVSARPVEVVVEGSPTIGADGTVARDRQRVRPVDGAYVAALSEAGQYALSIDGQAELSTTFGGTYRDQQGQDDVPVTSLPVLRPGGTASGAFTQFADSSRQVVRQPGGAGELALAAIETATRSTQTGPVRAMVGSLTLPGGARLLAGGAVRDGADALSWIDAAVLRPAGDRDGDALAWREKPDGDFPGWTAAMGPVGTRTVEWVRADGTTARTLTNATLATTDRTDVRSVRFLDADGRRIGSAGLTAPVGDIGMLPAVVPPGLQS